MVTHTRTRPTLTQRPGRFAEPVLCTNTKSSKSGGTRQFNGPVDVYKKTLASDGIAGLYRGFIPSIVGIIVYRGLYFVVYDSLSVYSDFRVTIYEFIILFSEPVVLVNPLEGSFFKGFFRSWLGCHRRRGSAPPTHFEPHPRVLTPIHAFCTPCTCFDSDPRVSSPIHAFRLPSTLFAPHPLVLTLTHAF